jgi:hypothetical protein
MHTDKAATTDKIVSIIDTPLIVGPLRVALNESR